MPETKDTPLKLGEEKKPPDGEQVIGGIVKLQTDIMRATNPHLRGQHPKAHGCVEAEFTVLSDIPKELKVGTSSRRDGLNFFQTSVSVEVK